MSSFLRHFQGIWGEYNEQCQCNSSVAMKSTALQWSSKQKANKQPKINMVGDKRNQLGNYYFQIRSRRKSWEPFFFFFFLRIRLLRFRIKGIISFNFTSLNIKGSGNCVIDLCGGYYFVVFFPFFTNQRLRLRQFLWRC